MVAAQVNGYQQDAGVIASPKHFPGHGDTATDSHTGIPVITHTREQWERIDAPPFKRGDQGRHRHDHERRTWWSRRWTPPATRPR